MASDGNEVEVAGAARTEFVQLEQRIVVNESRGSSSSKRRRRATTSRGRIYNFLPLRHQGRFSSSDVHRNRIRAAASVPFVCLTVVSVCRVHSIEEEGGRRGRVRSPGETSGRHWDAVQEAGQTKLRGQFSVGIYCSQRATTLLLRLSIHPLAM